MMDIIFFNELSQVLFMYDWFKKYSITKYAADLREENEDDRDHPMGSGESTSNLATVLHALCVDPDDHKNKTLECGKVY